MSADDRPTLLTATRLVLALAGPLLVSYGACSAAFGGAPRLVVVLYPQNNDGSPGNFLVDQSIRSTFASGSSESVEIYNEYLDVSHPLDESDRRLQEEYLRRKYAGRKVDLMIAGLSTALDFAVAHRDIFAGAPVVFCAVDHRELEVRNLPPDVIGVPIRFDLQDTLELALRLHPDTQNVAVVAGKAPMDAAWEREARKIFQPYENTLEFTYLTGLTIEELNDAVARLPERSVICYLHVFQDGAGRAVVPAHVLESLAQRANAPVYSYVDSYIGRGIVGGPVISFVTAARDAANLGMRILAGEAPQAIGIQAVSPNSYVFDGRRLRSWNIDESRLPAESVIRFREPSFWALYTWRVLGVAALCVLQAGLIVGLLVQRVNRRRAEQRFRQAVNAAPNGMLMVDRDGRIVLANKQIENLFGYTRAELIGQTVEVLVPEELRSEHARQRAAFNKSPQARAMGTGRDLLGRRKDGSRFSVEIGLSPLETDAGLFILASIIDVTERRQAEERLRTSQKELSELSGRLIGAQETERRRIARDLHDDFSQSLALLSVEIDLLRQSPPASLADLGPQLDEVATRVRHLSSSVHELSHELHPLKLEQLGLVAAIRGLCKEIGQNHRLDVDFTAEEVPEATPPDAALCLYRIVQESLRNVVKHSGAGAASVTLKATETELCLKVVDDGIGFDAALVNGRAGLGLISMRERLRPVGGEIRIDARPAFGTQITIRVPLRAGPCCDRDLKTEHSSI